MTTILMPISLRITPSLLLAISLLAGTFFCQAKIKAEPLPRIETPFTFSSENEIPPPNPQTIRICTWNIEWFPAGRRDSLERYVNYQIAAAAALVNEIKPDILLTQETRNLSVLRQLNRNLNPPGMSHLASSLFYLKNTAEAQENDTRIRQECGLLSRYPWKSIREIDFATLPRAKNKPARGWFYAHFEISGHDIHIYNGHLKSNFGAENPDDRAKNIAKRKAAIRELSNDLNREKLDPYRDRIIIVGDFNSDFFSKEFADETLFKDLEDLGFNHTFLLTSAEDRITIPSRTGEFWPSGTFDYIFLSSGWKLDGITAQVLQKGASKRKDVYGGDEAGLASDHYPVYVDLPLK
jgi:endonuclease/exonuclease/phosphatase family metal-dependent hydrolase